MMPAEMLDLTVGEFSRRIKRLIENNAKLQRIAIRGEVSKWNPQANGNLYFTLKDADNTLSCFAFASSVKRFPDVTDGVAVRAVGSIGVREQRSEYQLLVDELDSTGIGALAAQVEALRVRLEREGAFDPSRRRPIPRFVRRVALVSAAGDARQDFERQVRSRAPNVEVLFLPTRVQGKGADVEIAEALDLASKAAVDAIVLTRGGGSYEDRFAFNLEAVVRAILRSAHPVITAIGHAPDHHLADDVADLAAPTPTAAAERIAGPWELAAEHLARARKLLARGLRDIVVSANQRVDRSRSDLSKAIVGHMATRREHLSNLDRRLNAASPAARVAARRTRLASTSVRLSAWPPRAMDRARHALAIRDERLNALSPEKQLERGYAIVTKDGHAVLDATQVRVGDEIVARVRRGTLRARVEGSSDE